MYGRSVSRLGFENYEDLNEGILFCVHSHWWWIIYLFNMWQKNKKNDFPYQAFVNKLGIEKLPIQFQTIRLL